MKIKNKTLAMLAAPAAIPPNPNTPAIIAKIINVTVQRNIIEFFKLIFKCYFIKKKAFDLVQI